MPLVDARTSRVLLTILLFAAGMAFVYAAWRVLLTFLFAILFAYLIDPIVEFVARRVKISRGKAIALVYLAMFAGLVVLFLFIGPRIVHEAQKLTQTLPALYEKISSGQIAWQLGAQHGWSYDTKLKIQQFLQQHRGTIVTIARGYGERMARIGSNAWWLLLIPILAVFFLKDGKTFAAAVLEIFERRQQRDFVEGLLNDMHVMLAHYIRAQLTLAAMAMGVYVAFLSLMQVPYGLILGVIGGLLEFLPMVGPLVTALLIIGVALGSGYNHVLIVALFLGAWRVVQDYVNAPRIMGKQLELHPLAALFGILAGAEIGGIIGVYLSIPIMASLRIFWKRWRAYSRVVSPALTPVTDFTPVPESADRERSA